MSQDPLSGMLYSDRHGDDGHGAVGHHEATWSVCQSFTDGWTEGFGWRICRRAGRLECRRCRRLAEVAGVRETSRSARLAASLGGKFFQSKTDPSHLYGIFTLLLSHSTVMLSSPMIIIAHRRGLANEPSPRTSMTQSFSKMNSTPLTSIP